MILMIGATGLVGGDTVRALGGAGVTVRALVRSPHKAGWLRERGIELQEGDANDESALNRALAGVETVFVSTSPEPGIPELHARIVDAAKHAGVKRILKISATGADPRAAFRFGSAHGRSDETIIRSGLAYTILRPASFMQNLLGAAPFIAAQKVLWMPTGSGKMPMIDSRDIAAVAATVLTSRDHDGQIYELTGPEAVSGDEIAASLSEVLAERIAFVSPPPEQYDAALLASGVPEWIVGGLAELNSMFAAGLVGTVTPHVRNLLGREATSVAQFLRDHAAAFRGAAAQA